MKENEKGGGGVKLNVGQFFYKYHILYYLLIKLN